MQEEFQISGEYWIQDGSIHMADGDTGDANHATVALDYIYNKFAIEILDFAEELGIETELSPDDYEFDTFQFSQLISDIEEALEEQGIENPIAYMLQETGVDPEAFSVLTESGDPRYYVIVHEGWIAVRSNNAELYGFDNKKRQELVKGLWEILEVEANYIEDISPEAVEIYVFDFKTKKNFPVTLAELERPNIMPSQHQPTTTYNKSFVHDPRDPEENKYSTPGMSKPNPWTQSARQSGIVGPGQDLWRGTSENNISTFLEWLRWNITRF